MSSDNRELLKLKEFAELINQTYQPSSDKNLNYIGLEHIEQQTLRLNGIGNSSDVISQKHKFKAGDILFGKLRPYFRKVVRPSFDGVCSTDIWVVRAKPGFDQSFLFYFLANQNFIDACNSSSSGTRMPRADWNHLSETLWELPSLPKQKSIAKILSALDDKIELNRQTNATIEAIAQAIFKEWFVDFNYPGATGEQVDSELGPIPKGWRAGKLNEIFSVQIGGDWGKDSRFPGAKQAISLRGTDIDNLKSSGSAPNAPVRWIKVSSIEKRKIENTDVLIGGSGLGPIGKSIYCDEHLHDIFDFPITYSNFCKRLRAPSPSEAVFGEIILENLYKSGEMKQYFTGTSIPNLDINSLLDHNLIIPSKDILEEYYELISKCKFHHIFNNESKFLSQMRDSLIVRLMNDEVRI